MGSPTTRTLRRFCLLALLLPLITSCSIKRFAVDRLASSLSSGTDVFSSDNDPELIRDALPFALKATEALLETSPENENLLLTLCKGYTQYGFAFVQVDAEFAELEDYDEAQALRARALNLYLRARDFGLRGLEVRHPGIRDELSSDPSAAAARCEAADVPMMYWTAAGWGLAISEALDRPDIVADIDSVRYLIQRALELEPEWDEGAIHDAMIVIESFPEAMGGSPERARWHFEQAVALSGGLSASPYVALAEKQSVSIQDKAEFVSLLEQALAVDPDASPPRRVNNLISQKRARLLRSLADELFL